ncbi:MAG: complex I NDUFA9 subunit family protein [Halobacteriales archaeon]|nr:complex I NDUFA9 subunit family protein [Halobacteriales archaeon]
MKIVVFGGTGFIGKVLCNELAGKNQEVISVGKRKSGHEFTQGWGFTRIPSTRGILHRQGDIEDYEFVEECLEGVEVVYNLVALSPLYQPRGGNKKHDEIHRRGTENIVRAAEKCGVKRMIHMSAVGANSNAETAYLRAKGNAEKIVKKSSLEWCIFRPSVVFGEGGEFISFIKKIAPPYITPLPGGGKMRFDPIWVKDLVEIVVNYTNSNFKSGEIFEIGGPEIMSMAEITKAIHSSKGRSCVVVPIPMVMQKYLMVIAEMVPSILLPFGNDQYKSLKLDPVAKGNDVEKLGKSKKKLMTMRAYLAGK